MENPERVTIMYDCLSHSRRHYALYCLKDTEQPVPLADLAEDIAHQEKDIPRAEISEKTIEDVHISLYHNHVQKLADANLVQYDQEQDTVKLLDYPEELSNNDPVVPAE